MPMHREAGFELTFWIAPWNRNEFLQTAASLAEEGAGGSRACFEKVDEKNRFLWRERWESRDAVEKRLQSAQVRALMGAITTLGRVEKLEAIELHDRPASDNRGS